MSVLVATVRDGGLDRYDGVMETLRSDESSRAAGWHSSYLKESIG